MPASDEYIEQFDSAYDAVQELARRVNNTRSIDPPTLYQALGNLSGIAGFLQEALPSLARAARTGAAELELYDSEGGDPSEHLAITARTLEDAAVEAGRLLKQLQDAHSEIAGVGYR